MVLYEYKPGKLLWDVTQDSCSHTMMAFAQFYASLEELKADEYCLTTGYLYWKGKHDHSTREAKTNFEQSTVLV